MISEIEYQELKAEQRTRISIRNTLVYGTFTALGVTAAYSQSDAKSANLVLLIVPLVCFTLGWAHLRNDYKIAQIGRYLATANSYGWEHYREQESGRCRRLVIQTAVDLLEFVVTGFIALAFFWSAEPHGVLLLLGSAFEGLLLGTLAVEIFRAKFTCRRS